MQVNKNENHQRLKELLGDCDFSNDPSSIDNIIEYYELIDDEDDIFMQELVNKLPLMTVDWAIPPYQRLEGSVTRVLSEHYPELQRTDRFTHDEDQLLSENWNDFQKEFNIPNKPQSFARWRSKEKNKTLTCPFELVRCTVTAHLARSLQRSLQQVYLRFISEYAYPMKGAYSALEEQIMEVCFQHYRSVKSVTILSKVLGREPRGIYKRFKIFLNGKEEKKCIPKWTLDSASKLVDSLIQHSGGSLESLRDKQIDMEIWLKVQKDMDIPYDLLKKMWLRKLHVQCFLEKSITTAECRRKLYKVIKRFGFKRWRDIRWGEVAARFPAGCTAAFLHQRASLFARDYCPDYLHRPLSQMLQVWRQYTCHRGNRRLKLLHRDSEGKLHFKKYSVPPG